MKRAATIAFLAGLLPILAVYAAFVMNVYVGNELEDRFICRPFLDGCVSISRAARSGPGLFWFRLLMLPCVVLLVLTWLGVRSWLQAVSPAHARLTRAIVILGVLGSSFLALYVVALGSEGDWYRWMRRYGVTVYFGGTALAQLLLVRVLWPQRQCLFHGALRRSIGLLTVLVSFQWSLGVLSVAKRMLISDPDLVDRIENIIEWWFALPMSAVFILMAWCLWRTPENVRSTTIKS
jgi:hypothetical protein